MAQTCFSEEFREWLDKTNKIHNYNTEKIAMLYHNKQLKLCEVGVTLPTTEEIEIRLKKVVEKGFKGNEKIAKRDYSLGFRACYFWLKIRHMSNGN